MYAKKMLVQVVTLQLLEKNQPKWPDGCSSGESSEELPGRITTGHMWLISRGTGVSVECFCETRLSCASWMVVVDSSGFRREEWYVSV